VVVQQTLVESCPGNVVFVNWKALQDFLDRAPAALAEILLIVAFLFGVSDMSLNFRD